MRRFIIPVLVLLIERGLDFAGWQNIWIAVAFWSIGGLWVSWALVTWQPFREMGNKALRLRVIISDPQPSLIPVNVDLTDKGIFDYQSASFEAIKNIGETHKQLSRETTKASTRLIKYKKRFAKSKTPAENLKWAEKLAQDLNRYTETMKIHGADFQRNGSQLSTNALAWLEDEKTLDQENPETLSNFMNTTAEFRESNETFLNTLVSVRQNFNDSLRGYSQDVNRAVNNMDEAFGIIITAIQTIVTYCMDSSDTIEKLLSK